MHSLSILLVKWKPVKIPSKIKSFMNNYNFYDWYMFGWRRDWIINPVCKEFSDIAYWIVWVKQSELLISWDDISEYQKKLQDLWISLWNKWKHPWSYKYNRSCLDVSFINNIIPLSDCWSTVKEKQLAMNLRAEDYWDRAIKAKLEWDLSMSWYHASRYAAIVQEQFSFCTTVYNIDDEDTSIPEDTTWWYAVVIDMHN